jgi:hypothetical protein
MAELMAARPPVGSGYKWSVLGKYDARGAHRHNQRVDAPQLW